MCVSAELEYSPFKTNKPVYLPIDNSITFPTYRAYATSTRRKMCRFPATSGSPAAFASATSRACFPASATDALRRPNVRLTSPSIDLSTCEKGEGGRGGEDSEYSALVSDSKQKRRWWER